MKKVTFLTVLFLSVLLIVLFTSIPSFTADSSPGWLMTIPEVIWAPAAFGGEWATEILIHDINGGAEVTAFFYYGGGYQRIWKIWDNTGNGPGVWKSSNILKDLEDHLDPGFSYYGRIGALSIQTGGNLIQATARIYHNTGFGKTVNAYPLRFQNHAYLGSPLKIMNLIKSETYRSACVFFNQGLFGTVEFKVKGSRYLPCTILPGPPQGYDDVQYGSTFTKDFVSVDFMAFDPFAEAGVEEQGWCVGPPGFWQTYEYTHCYLEVNVISGAPKIYCYGATANNITNDPAAIIPMKTEPDS